MRQTQCAVLGNFLGTLLRHFLTRTVARLACRVIEAALAALLVPTVRLAAGQPALRLATRSRAVTLTAVAARANMEDRATQSAASLAEAVLVLMLC